MRLADKLDVFVIEGEEPVTGFPADGDRIRYFATKIADTWIGRPANELILVWGEPTKDTAQKRGGRKLIYKMEFPGRFQITPTCFIALSIDGPYPIAGVYHTIPGKPVREILGRLKARFGVDPEGIIVDADLLYLKWQKSRGAWAEHEADEPEEPGKPFRTGVKVNPD